MRFSKIKDNDIANGVGITMSLWTQGCPHHCKGCFNVETWDFNGGKEFTNSDLKYILDNINKNNISCRNRPFQIQRLFRFNINIITRKTVCTQEKQVNHWNLLQSPETVPHLEED